MNKKEIVATLKHEGLDIAEDMALVAVQAAIRLIKELAPKVSKGGGFMITAFLQGYEAKILELVDMIDGKKDLE